MRWLRLIGWLAVAAASCGVAGCSGDGGGPRASLRLVESYIRAFNDHDPSAIGGLAAEDVAWHYVAGDGLATESRGRGSLVEGMTGYFESLPMVRAELEHVHAEGSFAVGRERLFWRDSGGAERSQAAYAVYEIRDGLLRNVWYFPAEP